MVTAAVSPKATATNECPSGRAPHVSAPAEIVLADLDEPGHQAAIVALTQMYACDAMGQAAPLPGSTLDRLIPGLKRHPTTLVWLAFFEGQSVGIATCFLGFSTFFAKPLINVHDVAVVPHLRGRGIGRQLLGAVVDKARALGCCKVTLEVHENNTHARRVYESLGFAQAVYTDAAGGGLFYSKPL